MLSDRFVCVCMCVCVCVCVCASVRACVLTACKDGHFYRLSEGSVGSDTLLVIGEGLGGVTGVCLREGDGGLQVCQLPFTASTAERGKKWSARTSQ